MGYNVFLVRAGARSELDDRLKERLTGASLLVVLVVVLVPAMFRGEPPATPGGSVAGEPAASQIYTIDLQGAAPPVAEPVTAAPAEPAPLPVDAGTVADEPAVAPPAARVAATRPATRAAEPPAPKPADRPVDRSVEKPAAKSGVSAPPTPSRSTSGGSGFVVQVGSFTRQDNAAAMVKQAARKGVRLQVAGPDDRGIFRVRSAVLHSRQEAVALQEKLRAQGYRGVVGAVN